MCILGTYGASANRNKLYWWEMQGCEKILGIVFAKIVTSEIRSGTESTNKNVIVIDIFTHDKS